MLNVFKRIIRDYEAEHNLSTELKTTLDTAIQFIYGLWLCLC